MEDSAELALAVEAASSGFGRDTEGESGRLRLAFEEGDGAASRMVSTN